jgi:hypothetical protein
MPRDLANIDRALDILRRTNDGNDLIPFDLWLVQQAVNGRLDERGCHAFTEPCGRVYAGYRIGWLHGIEHLVMAPDGYVSWRDEIVEHYDEHLRTSGNGRRQALEIARRCRILEERGDPVTSTTVVWTWREPV